MLGQLLFDDLDPTAVVLQLPGPCPQRVGPLIGLSTHSFQRIGQITQQMAHVAQPRPVRKILVGDAFEFGAAIGQDDLSSLQPGRPLEQTLDVPPDLLADLPFAGPGQSASGGLSATRP